MVGKAHSVGKHVHISMIKVSTMYGRTWTLDGELCVSGLNMCILISCNLTDLLRQLVWVNKGTCRDASAAVLVDKKLYHCAAYDCCYSSCYGSIRCGRRLDV